MGFENQSTSAHTVNTFYVADSSDDSHGWVRESPLKSQSKSHKISRLTKSAYIGIENKMN